MRERDRYKKEWKVRMNVSIVLIIIIPKAKDPVHQNPIS